MSSSRGSLRQALARASLFACLALVLHVAINIRAQHIHYELFRDELYYIVCGRHLAWGYLDQPPFVALTARISETFFGLHSLAMFRMLPSLAGALEIAGAGLFAWEFGGGRFAQVFAMLGILCAPLAIALSGFLSMNGYEPLFWMGVTYAVLQVVRGGDPRWWVVAGGVAGVGLENKWNEIFFLLPLLAGLLLTPARRTLANRWFAVCVGLIAAIALPNLLWEIHRGWPTLEWLHNDATEGKNIALRPLAFIGNQIFVFNPVSCLLWIGGARWLLFARAARDLRWLGWMYALYLPEMIALHAKDYYLAGVYPLLFAAGGVAWSQWLKPLWSRRIAAPLYALGIVAFSGVGLVMTMPVLTPAEYVRFTRSIGLRPHETQTFDAAPLPQFLADMTGWRDMADKLADAYWSLSPQDRAKAVIYTKNYGGSSAVNVYRPDVPIAISGHQNYFFWGPRGHDGSVMVIFGDNYETDAREFHTVRVASQITDPWAEPYERGPIFICHGLKQDLRQMWPAIKFWY